MSTDPELPGAAIEGFRSAPRVGFLRALLPALLVSSLGYLLLAGAAQLGEPAGPRLARVSATLPQAAIVDEAGAPLFDQRAPLGAYAVAALGGLFVLCGPLLVIRVLRRQDPDEAELYLCRGALVLRRAGSEPTTLPWADLREVVAEPDAAGGRVVTLTRHDGSQLRLPERFGGLEPTQLAERIRAVRGRALFDLLGEGAWPERGRGAS